MILLFSGISSSPLTRWWIAGVGYSTITRTTRRSPEPGLCPQVPHAALPRDQPKSYLVALISDVVKVRVGELSSTISVLPKVTETPSRTPAHSGFTQVRGSRFFHNITFWNISSSGLNSENTLRDATRIIFRLPS